MGSICSQNRSPLGPLLDGEAYYNDVALTVASIYILLAALYATTPEDSVMLAQ